MKIKTKELIIIIILISSITIMYLNSRPNSNESTVIPDITIQSGDVTIDHVVGLNSWDGVDIDREDTFKVIIGNGFESLPYVKLDSEINIIFEEKMVPDEMELLDFVLDEKGDTKYTTKEVKVIPLNMVDEKGSYILDMHYASLLSSNSKDYEPGASIRGFKLICSWGKNQCEYAFIIRSDAQ